MSGLTGFVAGMTGMTGFDRARERLTGFQLIRVLNDRVERARDWI